MGSTSAPQSRFDRSPFRRFCGRVVDRLGVFVFRFDSLADFVDDVVAFPEYLDNHNCCFD